MERAGSPPAAEALGLVDMLVSNAGLSRVQRLEDITAAEFDENSQDFAVMIDRATKADQGLMPHQQGGSRAVAEPQNGTRRARLADSCQPRISTQLQIKEVQSGIEATYISWSQRPAGVAI